MNKIFLNFKVLAACVAASTAQLVSYPNGAVVPADEPAVAAAKAQFAAAGGVINPVIAGLPYAYAGYPYAAGYAAAYGYPYGGLVAHANGAVVPVDEPAVAAARADHLATKGVYGGVYANAGPAVYAAGYAGLQSFPNGAVVPVDEPAVAAARADHFAALAAAY